MRVYVKDGEIVREEPSGTMPRNNTETPDYNPMGCMQGSCWNLSLNGADRSAYPLRLVQAREDIRPGVVILGNAAHAIHPVGAQGFNLGLRDVAVLAEVLHDEISSGSKRRIGSPDVLRRYSDWRAPDQRGTIAYSDGLARLFTNPSTLVAAARTAALFAHALLPPLRRQLAVKAMGFKGNIPRLALGEPLGM